ncbi:MAG TPA: hypothetical protein VK667_14275 [Ktedonobacteraceae bacterium]|nr:hypothetical protein [Ktedonobacteraceae bacterium]
MDTPTQHIRRRRCFESLQDDHYTVQEYLVALQHHTQTLDDYAQTLRYIPIASPKRESFIEEYYRVYMEYHQMQQDCYQEVIRHFQMVREYVLKQLQQPE